jgi:hypothetical protein
MHGRAAMDGGSDAAARLGSTPAQGSQTSNRARGRVHPQGQPSSLRGKGSPPATDFRCRRRQSVRRPAEQSPTHALRLEPRRPRGGACWAQPTNLINACRTLLGVGSPGADALRREHPRRTRALGRVEWFRTRRSARRRAAARRAVALRGTAVWRGGGSHHPTATLLNDLTARRPSRLAPGAMQAELGRHTTGAPGSGWRARSRAGRAAAADAQLKPQLGHGLSPLLQSHGLKARLPTPPPAASARTLTGLLPSRRGPFFCRAVRAAARRAAAEDAQRSCSCASVSLHIYSRMGSRCACPRSPLLRAHHADCAAFCAQGSPRLGSMLCRRRAAAAFAQLSRSRASFAPPTATLRSTYRSASAPRVWRLPAKLGRHTTGGVGAARPESSLTCRGLLGAHACHCCCSALLLLCRLC